MSRGKAPGFEDLFKKGNKKEFKECIKTCETDLLLWLFDRIEDELVSRGVLQIPEEPPAAPPPIQQGGEYDDDVQILSVERVGLQVKQENGDDLQILGGTYAQVKQEGGLSMQGPSHLPSQESVRNAFHEERIRQEERKKFEKEMMLQKQEKNKAIGLRTKHNGDVRSKILLQTDYYKLFQPLYPSARRKGSAWVCDMEKGIVHHIIFDEDGNVEAGSGHNGFFPAGYAKLVNTRFSFITPQDEFFYFGVSNGEGMVVKDEWHTMISSANFDDFHSHLRRPNRSFLVFCDDTEEVLGFFRSNDVFIKDLLDQDIFLIDASMIECDPGDVKVGGSLMEKVKATQEMVKEKQTSSSRQLLAIPLLVLCSFGSMCVVTFVYRQFL